MKNPKTIYIDNLQVEQEPLIVALNAFSINNEINIVRVYFTTDAKNPVNNYEKLVDQLRGLKDSIELSGATTREALVSTEYAGDLLITELEYRITKLN